MTGAQRHSKAVLLKLGVARWLLSVAITRMFAGKALRFTLAGAIVGIAAALTLSRFLESLLFETSPRDPLSFAVAPAVLIGVSLIASWIPALRAARLNPVEALRTD